MSQLSSLYNHRPLSLPSWVANRGQDTGFRAGGALAVVDALWSLVELPQMLLRDRLAFFAAVSALKIEGRTTSVADLRDALHLARPEDYLSPDAIVCDRLRQIVRIRLTHDWQNQLQQYLPKNFKGHIQVWLNTDRQASPISQASLVLSAVLADRPREESAALILADVALSNALGWEFTVPLLSGQITRRDLNEENLPSACERAVLIGASNLINEANLLIRRKAYLDEVSPKLRAKASNDALMAFLNQDAVSPTLMLSPVILGVGTKMSDRAARRLCDRLVNLGAVRELTGRSTFRLYGL